MKVDMKDLDKTIAGIDNRTLYLIAALGLGTLTAYYAMLNLNQFIRKTEPTSGTVEGQIGGGSSPYWEDYTDPITGQKGKRRTSRKEGWESGIYPGMG